MRVWRTVSCEDRALGDFSGDGKADIMWRNSKSGTVAFWQIDGDSLSKPQILGQISANWQVIGSGDYNVDGQDDLLWYNKDDGMVAYWNSKESLSGGAPAGVVIASGVGTSEWNIIRQAGVLAS